MDIVIHDSWFSKMCQRALESSKDRRGFSLDPDLYQEPTEITRNKLGHVTQVCEPEHRNCGPGWILPRLQSCLDPVINFQLGLRHVALLLLDILCDVQSQRVASVKDALKSLEIFSNSAVSRAKFHFGTNSI